MLQLTFVLLTFVMMTFVVEHTNAASVRGSVLEVRISDILVRIAEFDTCMNENERQDVLVGLV